MQKIKLLPILALAFITVFSSCKKDDESSKSKEELLVGPKWKMTAATINPGIQLTLGGPTITDWYAQMDDCDKDDLMIFTSDGKVTSDEGAAKCASTDPQSIQGTYVWSADKTSITSTIDGEAISYKVTSISSSEMVAQNTMQLGGINYVLTITFRAQ